MPHAWDGTDDQPLGSDGELGPSRLPKREPVNTANLGRIAVDPIATDRRSGMVREALTRAAMTLWDRNGGTGDRRADEVVAALRTVARYADNETLSYIGRLLR